MTQTEEALGLISDICVNYDGYANDLEGLKRTMDDIKEIADKGFRSEKLSTNWNLIPRQCGRVEKT